MRRSCCRTISIMLRGKSEGGRGKGGGGLEGWGVCGGKGERPPPDDSRPPPSPPPFTLPRGRAGRQAAQLALGGWAGGSPPSQ